MPLNSFILFSVQSQGSPLILSKSSQNCLTLMNTGPIFQSSSDGFMNFIFLMSLSSIVPVLFLFLVNFFPMVPIRDEYLSKSKWDISHFSCCYLKEELIGYETADCWFLSELMGQPNHGLIVNRWHFKLDNKTIKLQHFKTRGTKITPSTFLCFIHKSNLTCKLHLLIFLLQ